MKSFAIKYLSYIFIPIISCVILSSCGSIREYNYDWTNDVTEYISFTFEDDIDIEIKNNYHDDGNHIYHCIIHDNYEFEFDLTCQFYDTVDFFIYERAKKITNDLEPIIGEYISDKYGQYDVTDKTIDEITDYVIETMNDAKKIADQYRKFKLGSPGVTFTFYNNENTFTWKNYSTDKEIIYNELKTLLST